MPDTQTLLHCDAQELRMEADAATARRVDLSKAVLAAVVALVDHDRRTLAELRALATRIERRTLPRGTEKSA